MSRPVIAPLLIPHGRCGEGCPWCPAERGALAPAPDAAAVRAAVARARDRRPGRPVELALYGGDLWSLPRPERTALLDAAEGEIRGGRAAALRVAMQPASVLRAPLRELQARGVRTVEIPIHSLDARTRRLLGGPHRARQGLDAIGRVRRARLRSVAHLTPGLPGSSHHSALASLDLLLRAQPDALRLLPALALQGTHLASLLAQRRWHPMRVNEAVHTLAVLIKRVRETEVELIRVGLRPEIDLAVPRAVLGGPDDDLLRLRAETLVLGGVALSALTSIFTLGTRAATLVVHPAEESFLRGPENRTVRSLQRQFRLERLRILPLADQPKGSIRAFLGEPTPQDIPKVRSRRAS